MIRYLSAALCRAFLLLVFSSLAGAACPIKTILIKGRAEHAPAGATIRVELVYPKKLGGDSGETTLDEGPNEGKFTIPIQFLTQSHGPGLNGLFEKCERKPTSIRVLLVRRDPPEEYDRVLLDLARDFTMVDSQTYELRSEVVLKGPQ
jgi:hypothetical protein